MIKVNRFYSISYIKFKAFVGAAIGLFLELSMELAVY